MKYSGPPMTLGNAAKAGVGLIVWCRACGRQIEPDPGEMAARYGAEMAVLEWPRAASVRRLRWKS